jgi:signal transduction histidine kinase
VVVNGLTVATISTPLTMLGELSLLTSQARTATLVAVQATEIYLIREEVFQSYFQELPAFFQQIFRNLAASFLAKETNLLSMMTDMENLVRKRTETLDRANEELRSLNAFKNSMIGMAAHDLRNPMNVVQGYLTLVLSSYRGQIPSEAEEFIARCRDVAKNTTEMLNQLLDVSLIDQGSIVLRTEKADLVALLGKTLRLMEILAARKKIAIHYMPPPRPCLATVDVWRVTQVFENLLTNAIKYSESGTRVTVSLAEENGQQLVAIQDEGPGISPADQEKIFTPFFRTCHRPTAGEQSTGLGLLIVKKIVELHGGILRLSSELGKGSTFTVGFPAARS